MKILVKKYHITNFLFIYLLKLINSFFPGIKMKKGIYVMKIPRGTGA